MKDMWDEKIEFDHLDGEGWFSLFAKCSTTGRFVDICLNAAKARKLAKKLIEKAERIEGEAELAEAMDPFKRVPVAEYSWSTYDKGLITADQAREWAAKGHQR